MLLNRSPAAAIEDLTCSACEGTIPAGEVHDVHTWSNPIRTWRAHFLCSAITYTRRGRLHGGPPRVRRYLEDVFAGLSRLMGATDAG